PVNYSPPLLSASPCSHGSGQGGRHLRRNNRLGSCDGYRRLPNQSAALLFQENELRNLRVKVDSDQVPQIDLARGHQAGKRESQVPLNRALEVTGSEFHVDPFAQQKVPRGRSAIET